MAEASIWIGQFSLALVGLALLVCAAGSITTIALLNRAMAQTVADRPVWLAGVAISFGANVWATHFIAMLAFNPHMPFAYRLGPTLLSILIAIGGAVLPFALVIRRPGAPWVTAVAGVMLGLTIAAMHFTGMAAMEMPVQPHYSLPLAAAAIISGSLFATLAVRNAGRGIGRACLYLMLAIISLHFIAMAGYSLPKTATAAMPMDPPLQQTDIELLAFITAGVSGMILLGAFQAITNARFAVQRAKEVATLHHLARHDELTGLPNRTLLRERLLGVIEAPDEQRSFALFIVDLDRFKSITDLYGYQTGDVLLTKVAGRLRRLIRDTDVVARVGTDEFIILQRGLTGPTQAAALAKRVVRSMALAFDIEGTALIVGASIGIAFYPDEGGSPEDVIHNANTALFRVKIDGGNGFCFFEPAMSAQLVAQRSLEHDVRIAIEQRQFRLYYQPIFDCRTAMLCGFEALLRWPHPTRGMVPPMEFIPFTERTGLIVKLGLWVLETACAEAVRWPGDFRISVNLSAVQLRHAELAGNILGVLQRTGLPPERLELEVTETGLIESPDQAEATIAILKAKGVQFALDDFGTGYSSLVYLRRFPFDRIKIDRSFIQNLATDVDSNVIVHAIIGLGHALHIDVLAEGVETAEQLRMLREQHCDEIQGYLLGRPTPPDSLGAVFAEPEPKRLQSSSLNPSAKSLPVAP